MARTRRKDWDPGPRWDAALDRAIDTADVAAAALFGEVVTDRDAMSLRAQLVSCAMIYFMLRIDPEDVRELWFGEGGYATLAYKPFPPDFAPSSAPFDRFWPLAG